MDVVALTGMPASGKSEVASALAGRGYGVVSMSAHLTGAAGRTDSPEDTIDRWTRSRAARMDHGPNVIAQRAWTEALESGMNRVVFDGVRTLSECAFLSAQSNSVLVVGFQRRRALRYARLRAGPNPLYDEGSNWHLQLDAHELALGIGEVLAMADLIIFSSSDEATLGRDAHEAALLIDREVTSAAGKRERNANRSDFETVRAFLETRR